MKVTVKSMKAGTFEVEADISKPVRLIKEAIYAEKKSDDLHPDAQRLIFSGRLLKDDDVLESLNFKENDFLVVMGGKRPAASKPAADKKDTASSKSEETPASSSTTEPKPASTTTSSSTPAAPSSGPAASEESLNTLTAMGFDRAQAERALSAAFGNIERAVEYLQNGIPTSAQPAAHQQGEQQQQQGEGEADSTTEEPTAESTTEASPAHAVLC
ncbi:hypothetical protein PTSG_04716 [Salpingoeca rosetta]|uniref:UV excision repair protein RAD23 n=1 Tax=Salpingoeca rosetta (strain ATCC 50818 / BSB-021) TaxID=946362 RepID=F2U9I0_SALR5|nr:uncharacterized protein PTSG_04716 [Salpingoeca rosetta]EGD73007.1 hypothetical protein PTSG_04716 [Salpingoeca rosetta]|eukprot:XP_004994038.1 hypothetical protein PTSG_04716 [Salpingoeca rosetta]